MRLFVALELPTSMRAALAPACERGRRGGILWVPAENVHLTLKFLGEVEYQRIPPLKEALAAAVTTAAPFRLSLNGCGCFPNGRAPRVIWLGVGEGGAETVAVAGAVEQALAPLGYAAETRAFRPHLTIGRVKDEKSGVTTASAKVKALAAYAAPAAEVSALALIKSTLLPAGAAYDEVARFPFGAGAEQPAARH